MENGITHYIHGKLLMLLCNASLAEVKENLEKFLAEGASWPLMDILGLDAEWNQTTEREWVLISKLPDVITSAERGIQEAETYQEKVCIKPGGFFRKAEYRMETKTRMARYPVTQALWQVIMGNNPSHFKGENHPVENISWENTQEFIKIFNERVQEERYRLPTEAEWEYACRSGSRGAYCFGDNESLLREYAWYGENSNSQTHSVGKKKPNAWGLYDMHGNVCEWCHDWYDDYPQGSITDPVGPSSDIYRVFRGGSWIIDAGSCRSANRYRFDPGSRRNYLGFRLAAFPARKKVG